MALQKLVNFIENQNSHRAYQEPACRYLIIQNYLSVPVLQEKQGLKLSI